MSSAASIGLGLIAAALAGIIVTEWRAREAWDEPAAHSVLALPPGERTQHVAKGMTDNSSQWIDTILARPLFTPDRRPPHQPHVEAAPVAAVGPPRLAGVLISPAGKAAIFAADGPKPIVVHEGGKLGQYTVQLIEAGRVTLQGPGGPLCCSRPLKMEQNLQPFRPPCIRAVPADGAVLSCVTITPHDA
jgi:hypothetical protein